jgi:osmotically-inducible protein OsmY
MKKSDADLKADVFQELDFDPALDSSLITVTANHGALTLSGSVPTYWQRMRAEDDTRRVYGVRSVANYLVVAVPSLYYRDDADIADAARSALAWHSDLPDSIGVTVTDVQKQIKNELERTVAEEAQNIHVDTSNGTVTLTGFVNSWSEDEAARRASWSVPGVTNVEDKLVVGSA